MGYVNREGGIYMVYMVFCLPSLLPVTHRESNIQKR